MQKKSLYGFCFMRFEMFIFRSRVLYLSPFGMHSLHLEERMYIFENVEFIPNIKIFQTEKNVFETCFSYVLQHQFVYKQSMEFSDG